MKTLLSPTTLLGLAALLVAALGLSATLVAPTLSHSSAQLGDTSVATAAQSEVVAGAVEWMPIMASTSLARLFATSNRSINAPSIAEALSLRGKMIAADLVNMKLYLYQDGTSTAVYPILTKGRPGSPYETPGGTYQVLTKETDHLNKAERVHMPYSMQFYGNYFIHGWPTYADGTPVSSTYSGGCIRLSTSDAALVYAFADRGTEVFVYDTGAGTSTPSIPLGAIPFPQVSASAYLVADIDSGDIYAAHDERTERPIASLTKLMTALVANETIMFDQKISVPRGELHDAQVATDTTAEIFTVGNLLYPLLMESNNSIADILASHYGKGAFVAWMNNQAQALGMASTSFADASGVSRLNSSTPEDLYRLAVYLADKKSFVWNITRTPYKEIVADDGSRYAFNNFNLFSGQSSFIGGKVGHTDAAQDTMISLFRFPVLNQLRRVAVIVLGSSGYATDTKRLADWFARSAATADQTACAACALAQGYRKIGI